MAKPKPLGKIHITLDDFMAHVDTSGECWLWTGYRHYTGYGVFCKRRAHRLSYLLHYGVDPGFLIVLHRCDNPPCVNPAHLFLGDDRLNNEDRIAKGRHPTARLSSSDAREIRRLLAEGSVLQKDLAARFGVDPSLISHIKRRKKWVTLDDAA